MSIWVPVLFTPEPYVIRDSDNERDDKSIATVEGFDCAEAIFEIIAPRGIEENAIEFKPESATVKAYKVPDTPELAGNPVDVSRLNSVISVDVIGERMLTRDVEIGDAKDSINREELINLINHRKIPSVNRN